MSSVINIENNVESMSLSLADRKKRLVFRSWHRGTREMDLIMGRFADAHVAMFSADQVDAYERLLTCQDPDLYDWYIAKTPVPAADDSDVMQMFLGFHLTK